MNTKILQPTKKAWLSPKNSPAENRLKFQQYLDELTKVRKKIRLLTQAPTDNLKIEVIRRLNDLLRIHHYGGRVIMTQGVSSLHPLDQIDVLDALTNFDNFNEDNDPYFEHDGAAFDVKNGETYRFKIDYFDNNLEYHSPDNTNPAVTTRVMTIMTPIEY